MRILVIAEHDNKTLKSSNYNVIKAANELGEDVELLICGFSCGAVVKEAEKLFGLKKILIANIKDYEHQLPENIAVLIAEQSKAYDYVLTSAGTFGKNLLPRVAALLNVNMVSDVVKIVSPDTFVRPIYAGNVLITIQITEKIKLLTIRTTAFAPIQKNQTKSIPIKVISTIIPNKMTEFVSQELTPSNRPELISAKIVVSGGRGIKSAENFKMLEALADQMGAALAASRAAVDAGFAPNDYQVGQTGKVVAPDLYIAIGISGAIQHLAGMKDSKIVVAINNDPEAPIFEVADYSLVADLFDAIPELQTELSKKNKDR
jgi:electron transfer flavoprotein alpha subunit